MTRRTRDYTRWQEERSKERAEATLRRHWWPGDEMADDPRWVGIIAHTPKLDRGWCKKEPRRKGREAADGA